MAHALGMSADHLRYGSGPTLAGALRRAGFTVYLWTHRGDAEAIPPDARARSEVDFDRILERDLPAAVDRVCADADHPRLHLVGHGLGGQLAMCWAAGRPDALGAVVAIASPVRFTAASLARRTARALSLLPARWRIPLRAAARLSTPFLDDAGLGPVAGDLHSRGARVRGGLAYASEDLPVRLLSEVLDWHREGSLVTGRRHRPGGDLLGRGGGSARGGGGRGCALSPVGLPRRGGALGRHRLRAGRPGLWPPRPAAW